MAKINFTNKNTGDQFKAIEANEIKTSVNSLYDLHNQYEDAIPFDTFLSVANIGFRNWVQVVEFRKVRHIDSFTLQLFHGSSFYPLRSGVNAVADLNADVNALKFANPGLINAAGYSVRVTPTITPGQNYAEGVLISNVVE